jgi:hypothetical protein
MTIMIIMKIRGPLRNRTPRRTPMACAIQVNKRFYKMEH